jgi:hypothetical protein
MEVGCELDMRSSEEYWVHGEPRIVGKAKVCGDLQKDGTQTMFLCFLGRRGCGQVDRQAK